jgi:pantoate kinase
VNGDRKYDARTSRKAVQLLLWARGGPSGSIDIEQAVGTPIGSGFGASAASAVSAVYGVASAVGIRKPKKELAQFAHRAEIEEQTGLGTVSVVYDHAGAGAITRSGIPGEVEFITVRVPKDLRLVTAYIAPFDKKDALSSPLISEKINRLGKLALGAFLSDPSIDSLGLEGERFSERLGLETPEIKKLIATSKAAGASHASQNMIGYAIHSLAYGERAKKIAAALKELYGVRVDTFEVGKQRAGVIPPSRRSRGPS